MMDPSARAQASARPAERRARLILAALVGLSLLGLACLFGLLPPYGGSQAALDIELQSTAQGFKQQLLAHWASGDASACGDGSALGSGRPNIGRLRCHLLADSVLLVPGYVGLLVFFTLSLSGMAGRRGYLPHLLCLPAVAAGLFDLAENGMRARAAEQLLYFVLADESVLDVRAASLSKWWLLSASAMLVAGLALGLWARLGKPGRQGLAGAALLLGGLLMGAAALAWAWTLSASARPQPIWGMAAMAAGLLSLLVWRWRELGLDAGSHRHTAIP